MYVYRLGRYERVDPFVILFLRPGELFCLRRRVIMVSSEREGSLGHHAIAFGADPLAAVDAREGCLRPHRSLLRRRNAPRTRKRKNTRRFAPAGRQAGMQCAQIHRIGPCMTTT